MPRVQMPDGSIVEMPEKVTPELAQRLSAYRQQVRRESAPTERESAYNLEALRQKQGTGMGAAALDNLNALQSGTYQGLTANFADRIMGAIGAATAKAQRPDLFEGQSFGDVYGQARDIAKGQMQASQEANPYMTFAGNVAGGAALPINRLRAMAAYGGLSALGATDDRTPGGMAATALLGAGTGAGAGYLGQKIVAPALGGLANVAGRKLGLIKTPPAPASSASQAPIVSALYAKADELGGSLKPQVAQKFIKEASEELRPKSDFVREARGPDEAMDTLALFQKYYGREPMSLSQYEDADKFLTAKISSLAKSTTPTAESEARRLGILQQQLRGAAEAASPEDIIGGSAGFEAYRQARIEAAKKFRLQKIEEALSKKSVGEQPAKAIRQKFATMAADSKNELRGFTPKEKELVKEIGESGGVFDLGGLLASRLGPVFGLGAANPAVAGGMAFTGSVTREAMEAYKRAQVQNLLNTIQYGNQFTAVPYLRNAMRPVALGATSYTLGGLE